jgi:hypothetical protein
MWCNSCEVELSGEARYCPNCGGHLSERRPQVGGGTADSTRDHAREGEVAETLLVPRETLEAVFDLLWAQRDYRGNDLRLLAITSNRLIVYECSRMEPTSGFLGSPTRGVDVKIDSIAYTRLMAAELVSKSSEDVNTNKKEERHAVQILIPEFREYKTYAWAAYGFSSADQARQAYDLIVAHLS